MCVCVVCEREEKARVKFAAAFAAVNAACCPFFFKAEISGVSVCVCVCGSCEREEKVRVKFAAAFVAADANCCYFGFWQRLVESIVSVCVFVCVVRGREKRKKE